MEGNETVPMSGWDVFLFSWAFWPEKQQQDWKLINKNVIYLLSFGSIQHQNCGHDSLEVKICLGKATWYLMQWTMNSWTSDNISSLIFIFIKLPSCFFFYFNKAPLVFFGTKSQSRGFMLFRLEIQYSAAWPVFIWGTGENPVLLNGWKWNPSHWRPQHT